jgi:hypothetical protein
VAFDEKTLLQRAAEAVAFHRAPGVGELRDLYARMRSKPRSLAEMKLLMDNAVDLLEGAVAPLAEDVVAFVQFLGGGVREEAMSSFVGCARGK